jgi:heterodisulfide reductase subunit A-like polyferredoxin
MNSFIPHLAESVLPSCWHIGLRLLREADMMTGDMQPKVIIVGGGVSGLGLAWRLSSRGMSACVLESDRVVGGLARTERCDGK